MKFVWEAQYIDGHENTHTIICDREEKQIVDGSGIFSVKLTKDNGDILTDEVDLIYYKEIYDENGNIIGTEEEVYDETEDTYPCISGQLPEGIKIKKFRDGMYGLSGTLPIINEDDKTYFFTVRGRVKVTNSLRTILMLDEDIKYLYDDMFFSVIVKNKTTIFISDTDTYTFTENIYNKIQLELANPEGNEEFIKISGKLPEGISLSSNGLLYGIAKENSETSREYKCTIGIRRNDEIIIREEIKSTVIKLSSLKKPVWITDAGKIAILNFGDVPDSSLFVKAYDPNGLSLTYSIPDEYELPDGLSLSNTGKFYGKCKTEDAKLWSFVVSVSNGIMDNERIFKIETNKASDDKFINWITDANLGSYKIGDNVFLKIETESKYKVKYSLVSNNLPDGLSFNEGIIYGKIKYQDLKNYTFIIEADNGYINIQKKFYLTLEKGFGKNALKCYFYINHEYDSEYKNMLSYFNRNYAYESKNTLYKINSRPEIDICECKCFDKELMKHLLYYNDNIDIIWDITKRKNIFNGESLLYTAFYKEIKETPRDGETQNYTGDKIYVTESSKSSTGYYIEGSTTEIKPRLPIYTDYNSVINGKPYIKIEGENIFIKKLTVDNYYIESTNEVIDNNETIYTEAYEEYNFSTLKNEILYRKYILRNDKKYYLKRCKNKSLANLYTNEYLNLLSNEVEIYYTNDNSRKYFIDDNRFTKIMPSIENIRNALNTQIVVTKDNNEHVYYECGSQEIIEEKEIENKYILYYDDDKQSYYVRYDGEPVYMDVYAATQNNDDVEIKPAYAFVTNENWIAEADNKDASQTNFDNTYDNMYSDTTSFKYVIDGNETKYIMKPVKVLIDFLDTPVDYQNYFIFEKGTQNLQENILFTLDWNPAVKFIMKNGNMYFVNEISKPWIYEPKLNSGLNFNKRIVLPYINDEDVEDLIIRGKKAGKYIKFFDKENETIAKWKSNTIDTYKVDMYYYPNDIFKVKNTKTNTLEYYKVKNTFKSGENYEDYKNNYLIQLNQKEIDDLLKEYYFPALPLFYSRPLNNSDVVGMSIPSELEKDESNGKLLTGRKFCFFEVHFSPLYNNNIDNFSIDFYNHNNDRSPEFQLI